MAASRPSTAAVPTRSPAPWRSLRLLVEVAGLRPVAGDLRNVPEVHERAGDSPSVAELAVDGERLAMTGVGRRMFTLAQADGGAAPQRDRHAEEIADPAKRGDRLVIALLGLAGIALARRHVGQVQERECHAPRLAGLAGHRE